MAKFSNKKTFFYTVCAVVIIFILAAAGFSSGFLRMIRSLSLSPVEQAAGRTGGALALSWNNISGLLNAASENRKLRDENRSLKAEIDELTIYRHENIRLKSLLNLKESLKYETIAAEVCGRDINSWFLRFEINKGKNDGVKKNMPVLSDRGLVGVISDSYPGTAAVRTILHNKSMTPVYIVESGAFALLEGEGGVSGTLRYIYNASLIDVGQLVVTSGLGDIYPGGLVIGVTEKNYKGEVTVRTFADIATVKRVLVLDRTLGK